MQPGGGRSRGRARTVSRQEPVPVQPGSETPPPTEPVQIPVPQLALPVTAVLQQQQQQQSSRTGSPQPTNIIQQPTGRMGSPQRPSVIQQTTRTGSPGRIVQPKTGRGRASATVPPPTTTTPAASGSSPSASSAGSATESPPQQHSPTNGQPSVAIGRAALRGSVNQPGITTSLLSPLDRLSLQETGERGAAAASTGAEALAGRPRAGFILEQVPYTKPPSCTNTKGIEGVPIKLLCNYFEVVSIPGWVLHQYHVDFIPEIDSKKQRTALFNIHRERFPTNLVFDGMIAYSLTRLPDAVTEVASTRETDNQIIRLIIKHVGEVTSTSPQFVQLFNIVFRRCLRHYGMKMIDRHYFDSRNRLLIPNFNIELMNGFATSISTYDNNKLLLCAELAHKLLHKETILDLMDTIYEKCRNDQTVFRERCSVELIGRIFMTSYDEKTYKIDDIDWNSKPTDEFELSASRGREARRISFIDYYKTFKQKDIKHIKQPLLVVQPKPRDIRRGKTKPDLFIPELAVVTGIDDNLRENFRFKKALDQYTKIDPAQRYDRLTTFVRKFNDHQQVQEELNKWSINFSSAPCEISARVLPPETLLFGKDRKKLLNEKADWGMDLKSEAVLHAIFLKTWIVIFPSQKKHVAEDFVNTFGKVITSLGIPANEPGLVQLGNDQPDTIVKSLKAELNKRPDIQMVVVLVTSKRKDRYDAIKRICCLELPVPSQVVTTAIIEDIKKKMAVVTKVAIQMNCKLGGSIWATNIPIKNLMICGIDTYHDSAKKNSSVCAFISTSDQNKTKYFSRATIQETHQELSDNLTLTVKSACEHYKKQNGSYPEKIIIYRDGVSDGQLRMVYDYEIPQIQKAFSSLGENYNPLLTFIVVKKRGNTRFFNKRVNPQGVIVDLINPPCGTVIDTVVTRQEWFDFYLIPQVVTQGTVNPTHFNIIYDTNNLLPDRYQRLSYKLSHMYYNWPGTIRVPAPCQYAHKLAFLVGQSLHKEHHHSLADKLFYL